MRSLPVFVSDQEVGILREDPDTGLIDFAYKTSDRLQPSVSLTMPATAAPEDLTGFNGLPPPFEISLPEGYILDILRQRFAKQVDVDDDLALLRIVGRNTIGRVTFGGPAEHAGVLEEDIAAAARSPGAAARLQSILKDSPQLFGVSGVMPKAAAMRAPSRPGTLVADNQIVKFDARDYPGASLVEYACLMACRKMGLKVPGISLSPDADALTIDRFDRDARGAAFGFEDACALSGLRRSGKYSGYIDDLFQMVGNFVHPVDQSSAREQLLLAVLMNDAVRNGDAHLKNFGLLYEHDESRPVLAPTYDVLTTQAWIRHDAPALGMSLDDPDPRWLDSIGLESLAKMADVSPAYAADMHRACLGEAISSLEETLADVKNTASARALSALHAAVEVVKQVQPIAAQKHAKRETQKC